ncbi:hypothetical protein ACUN7Z_09855 [Vreelandella venusta]|uniref:hypothetical protein n=1 Tax=Vreelandella venusta TaxID=44935 RepID=UPI00404503AF
MSNSITTVNPATGETLETYALMDASQAKPSRLSRLAMKRFLIGDLNHLSSALR